MLSNSGNQAGRDNSGSMATFRDVGVYNAAPFSTPPVDVSVAKAKPQANLVALDLEIVHGDISHIYGINRDERTSVLPIRNVIPSDESGTSQARGVCASIVITDGLGFTHHVTRAYWVGEYANEVRIDINAIRKIVLGRFYKGMWIYYENPRDIGPIDWRGDLSPVYDDDNLPPCVPLVPGPIYLAVEVFNPYNGLVYARASVSIEQIGQNAYRIMRK